MNGVSTVFLGVIAVAALAMAIGQVGLFLAALRLARRVEALSTQVEREIGPLAAKLSQAAGSLQQASGLAAAQIERVDRLFAGASRRADDTMALVHGAVVGPIREGLAVLAAARAVVGAIRAFRRSSPGRAAPKFDDEDPLFIG